MLWNLLVYSIVLVHIPQREGFVQSDLESVTCSSSLALSADTLNDRLLIKLRWELQTGVFFESIRALLSGSYAIVACRELTSNNHIVQCIVVPFVLNV
jgi:hypothetical protein